MNVDRRGTAHIQNSDLARATSSLLPRERTVEPVTGDN
jgi:hypothetical protein